MVLLELAAIFSASAFLLGLAYRVLQGKKVLKEIVMLRLIIDSVIAGFGIAYIGVVGLAFGMLGSIPEGSNPLTDPNLRLVAIVGSLVTMSALVLNFRRTIVDSS